MSKLLLLLIASIAASVLSQDPICANGIPGGYGLKAACCAESCGTCGGGGCGRRPGGASNCCGGTISRTAGRDCDLVGPPCIMNQDPDCSTGIYDPATGVCCASNCGNTCAGVAGNGCESAFSNDDTESRCCAQQILSDNLSCDHNGPPCVVSRGQGSGGDSTCANGIPDNGVCCPASCGSCGGAGCARRPGGASACCSGTIKRNGLSCISNQAPCIL